MSWLFKIWFKSEDDVDNQDKFDETSYVIIDDVVEIDTNYTYSLEDNESIELKEITEQSIEQSTHYPIEKTTLYQSKIIPLQSTNINTNTITELNNTNRSKNRYHVDWKIQYKNKAKANNHKLGKKYRRRSRYIK